MATYQITPNDSYSKEILNYLKDKVDIKEEAEISICFPCNIENFKFSKKNILILDHAYFAFNDVAKLISFDWDLIVTAKELETEKKQIVISFHDQILKSQVKVAKTFRKEYIYCSQPIKEDEKNLAYDQYELEAFLKSIFDENELLLRAHPREERVSEVEGSINFLLENYDKWIGHSSTVLYGARSLGHKVLTLEQYPNLNDDMRDIILQFIKEKKKPCSAKKDIDIVEILKI